MTVEQCDDCYLAHPGLVAHDLPPALRILRLYEGKHARFSHDNLQDAIKGDEGPLRRSCGKAPTARSMTAQPNGLDPLRSTCDFAPSNSGFQPSAALVFRSPGVASIGAFALKKRDIGSSQIALTLRENLVQTSQRFFQMLRLRIEVW